jgi:hypothetical protein
MACRMARSCTKVLSLPAAMASPARPPRRSCRGRRGCRAPPSGTRGRRCAGRRGSWRGRLCRSPPGRPAAHGHNPRPVKIRARPRRAARPTRPAHHLPRIAAGLRPARGDRARHGARTRWSSSAARPARARPRSCPRSRSNWARPWRRRPGPDRPHAAAAHRRQQRGQAHRRGTEVAAGRGGGLQGALPGPLQPGASVKLMTDGILLAETQTDPLLKAYDTLIIDEAHERSLNIDFLLGYLRQILPRRPDLKVIVTSATIDADRFAKHFASAQGPAPVIMVSGRCFRWSSAGGRSRKPRLRPERRHRRRGGRTVARRAGRHPGLPARRARDPRGADHLRKHLAQQPADGPQPRSCRCSRACRRPSRTVSSKPATAGASCWPPTWPRPR